MGKRVRHGISLGTFLEIIVADFLRGVESLLYIAVLKRAKHLIVMMSPYAGIIIGLKLKSHTNLVGLRLAESRHTLVGIGESAEQILHMVAHLMGYDIGIGKVSVGTESAAHFGEKRQVYIQALVGRTIERTGLGSGVAAAAVDRTGEKYERGRLIFKALFGKKFGPYILRSGKYLFGKSGKLLFLSGRRVGRRLA